MEFPEKIRFSSLISDPEAYIQEMFQLHPDATHDKHSGSIDIKTPFIDSSFRYLQIQEGLFLFSFSSYSPVDAEYEFIANPGSDFYTLAFYFTDEKTKNPLYFKTDEYFYSNDKISMFFNGNMTAEVFLKAKHKSSGIRIELHKKWLMENVQYDLMLDNYVLKNILDNKTKGFVTDNCQTYKEDVNCLSALLSEKDDHLQVLKIKSVVYRLIADYFKSLLDNTTHLEDKESLKQSGELQQALNYLKKKIYAEFPGNLFLSQLCNISESNFNKKFRTAFNITAAHYFASMKMKEALRLLQLGNTVKNVSYKIGFKDTSAFGRSFKKYFGKSPASYIKK